MLEGCESWRLMGLPHLETLQKRAVVSMGSPVGS